MPVVFGLALVAAVCSWWPTGWARAATLAAALLTAVSPAMVYFSRYYIQEMLLVFFTFAAIGVRHGAISARGRPAGPWPRARRWA